MPASPEPDSPLGVIRIVVVVPGGKTRDGPPPMEVETTAGLARLGDPVELLRAQTLDEINSLLGDPSIDLVLLDRLDVTDAVAMLEAIRSPFPRITAVSMYIKSPAAGVQERPATTPGIAAASVKRKSEFALS